MKNQNFNESIRIPMTSEMKEQFKDACWFNRTKPVIEIRKFIENYKRDGQKS